MDLVSVIVPCYNQSQFLVECIDSVVAQTYQNWECIIVNDGSQDDTESIAMACCARDSRIKYFQKTNGGLPSARNYGIKRSQGFYILPLDADDKIGNRYLELAVEEFKRNTKAKLVYCRAKLFGDENGEWRLPQYSFRNLLLVNAIFCSAIYKRKDFDHIGGYDESLVYGAEDWNFWLSLLEENDEVVRLDSVQFFYRKKQVSMHKDLVSNEERNVQTRLHLFYTHFDKYLAHFGDPITMYQKAFELEDQMRVLKKSKAYRFIQKLWVFNKKVFG